MPENSAEKSQTSVFQSRYFRPLMYGLGILLFFALMATLLALTGGAIALPLIGGWFVGMNSILGGFLAATFITAIIQLIIIPFTYALNKIIQLMKPDSNTLSPDMSVAMKPVSSTLNTAELMRIESLLPYIRNDIYQGTSLVSHEDEALISSLQNNLDNNLEQFVGVLLEKQQTPDGLIEAFLARENLAYQALNGDFPEAITISKPELIQHPPMQILDDINRVYLPYFQQIENQYGNIRLCPSESRLPTNKQEGYRLRDISRFICIFGDKPLSDISIPERLRFDAIQFVINEKIRDLIHFRMLPNGEAGEEAQTLSLRFHEIQLKVRDIIEKKMFGDRQPVVEFSPPTPPVYGTTFVQPKAPDNNNSPGPQGSQSPIRRQPTCDSPKRGA